VGAGSRLVEKGAGKASTGSMSPVMWRLRGKWSLRFGQQSSYRGLAWLLAALVLAGCSETGDEITVAVAANFAGPAEAIATEFEADTGYSVRLAVGASGRFFAQIQQGAPFDVFLSADQAKPAALLNSAAAVKGSRFTYAVGVLALWSTQNDLIGAGGAVVCQNDYQKLAIANPQLAPYGEAAVQTLQALGCYDHVVPKLVRGENVAQTYQFVASGNAQLGFVALSQIAATEQSKTGSRWVVPSTLHEPIKQDAVLLQRSADNAGAKAFLQFLRSEKAQRIMIEYGYRIPSEALIQTTQ